jgi:acetyl-CoA acyltransferase
MTEAYLCAGRRSAIGRFGGALAHTRPDDLLAQVIRAAMADVPGLDPMAIDDVIMGCANQAGEDNRNVARMAGLLAGLPERFVNRDMRVRFGIDSMPETAENVAEDFGISRQDQDAYAHRSQLRVAAAIGSGRFTREIAPIILPQRRGNSIVFDTDEHPRATPLEKLAALATPFRENGSVTAGNASGVNDGAAALIVASEAAVAKYGLVPLARIAGTAVAGVAPRIMGIGPVPATQKLLTQFGLQISDIDVIELNEAFAAQSLAVLRELGLADNANNVNPNGGAIALGHPLGMSGARLALTAAHEMQIHGHKWALCTMCIGVGQGIAMLLGQV